MKYLGLAALMALGASACDSPQSSTQPYHHAPAHDAVALFTSPTYEAPVRRGQTMATEEEIESGRALLKGAWEQLEEGKEAVKQSEAVLDRAGSTNERSRHLLDQ